LTACRAGDKVAVSEKSGLNFLYPPTGNLDRHTGQEVMAVLERVHHNGGTVLLVTHDPEIVLARAPAAAHHRWRRCRR